VVQDDVQAKDPLEEQADRTAEQLEEKPSEAPEASREGGATGTESIAEPAGGGEAAAEEESAAEATGGQAAEEGLVVGELPVPETEEEEEEEEEERLDVEAEVEEVSPTTRRVRGRVLAEKINKILDRYWEELRDSAQVRGFRKGRVPRRLLERRLGRIVYEELRKQLLDQAIREISEDYGLRIIGEPEFGEVTFIEGQPLEFEFTCEVLPEFAIPPYEDIEIVLDRVTVTDEEVDAEIERLREERAQWISVDDWPPQKGDRVTADITLRAGPKILARLENTELGTELSQVAGVPVPELPELLCSGKREISFELSVPEDHPDERLRARRVQVDLKLHERQRRELPEVNDSWAELFGCKSVDELRTHIAERLKERKKSVEERLIGDKALEAMLKRVEIPVPESLIKGLSEEESTEEDSSEEKAPNERGEAEKEPALENLRRRILIDRIAETEGIKVGQQELEEALAATYGVDPRSGVLSEGLIGIVRRHIIENKVRELLRSRCRVVREEEEEAAQGAAAPEESEANGEAEDKPQEAGARAETEAQAEAHLADQSEGNVKEKEQENQPAEKGDEGQSEKEES